MSNSDEQASSMIDFPNEGLQVLDRDDRKLVTLVGHHSDVVNDSSLPLSSQYAIVNLQLAADPFGTGATLALV